MAAPCFIAHSAATSALTAPMSGVATSTTSGTVKTILPQTAGFIFYI